MGIRNKSKKLIIGLLIILIIGIMSLIIGIMSYLGYQIHNDIVATNKWKENNTRLAISEIQTTPKIKNFNLQGSYNNNIYASIIMKSISKINTVVKDEISDEKFSSNAPKNIKSELDNAIIMKLLKNFEDYINGGNLKLNIPGIEKEIGVKNSNDIFVSAKIVNTKEPDLPNRNYYINVKTDIFKNIKIPDYNGGDLEIVFLNKKNVANILNTANKKEGEMKYKVSDSNIDGFDILLAYMWMNNSYIPLYYTNTSLYSGTTGWTNIKTYKNGNNEDEDEDENENTSNNSENESSSVESSINNAENSSSIEDEDTSSNSNSNISESENSSSSASADDDSSCGGGDDD